jgi:hypothetical protein
MTERQGHPTVRRATVERYATAHKCSFPCTTNPAVESPVHH